MHKWLWLSFFYITSWANFIYEKRPSSGSSVKFPFPDSKQDPNRFLYKLVEIANFQFVIDYSRQIYLTKTDIVANSSTIAANTISANHD